MDIISTLPDELLVKILLLVPTKDAVSTSILSKRWEHLWMLLPKLVYGRRHSSNPECRRLRSFIDINLPLHKAPVIETFRLELWCSCFERENINMWVSTAVSQCVIRELEILDKYYRAKPNILPSNLFTCKSLVVLKLNGDIILDVPGMVSLPSLKTLKLQGVRYSNEDTLPRLLSNCPILEDLVVKLCWYNERKLNVVAPSLPRLTFVVPYNNGMDGYVIETPSLKYFKLKDHNDKSHYCLIDDMPFLVEAYVDVMCPDIKSIVGSLKYVKRLGICSETMLGEGIVFNQLEHLDVCICEKHSPNQLVQLLKYSPNLQVLHLFYMKHHEPQGMEDWNQPTTVPECLLSSLQSLSWLEYTGEPQEREIAVYILKHALHLKTATIESSESGVPKFEMLNELALSSGASAACKLMFE